MNITKLLPVVLLVVACEQAKFVGKTPTDNPVKPAEVSNDTYKGIKQNILSQHGCMKCHATGGKAEDVPLETVKDLLNKQDDSGQPDPMIVVGNPDASQLFLSVSSTKPDDSPMPPLKARGSYPALSSEEVRAIRDWIAAGAKE